MLELIRKKYRLELELFGKDGKPEKFYFDFYQGSLRELITMRYEIDSPEKIAVWLENFLMEKTTHSDNMKKEYLRQWGSEQRTQVLEFIMSTYAKGYFKPAIDYETKETKYRSPSSSMICLILEKTSETLETLLGMTWEQVNYLIEGIVWNIQEQTKEGQKLNQRHIRLKDLAEGAGEKEMEELKKLEERISQKFKK